MGGCPLPWPGGMVGSCSAPEQRPLRSGLWAGSLETRVGPGAGCESGPGGADRFVWLGVSLSRTGL